MSRFLVPSPSVPIEPGPIPSFSILITTYQSASTLSDAVASALAQTRPALEVIVCDDGSTDDVGAAVAGYRDRIHLLRKPNGGGASALNHAARAARGDFVAILDADDVYDARRIEAVGDLGALRPDLDIITTDAYFEVDGKRVGRFNCSTPFVVDDQRAGILRSCFVGGWPAVRRARVLGAGGWDQSFRIGYDWDRWLRLILDGARAGLVDEPLMSYRLHGSLTANRVESLQERVRLLEKAFDHPSLTRRESRVLHASIRWQRSRLLREVAEEEEPRRGWGRAGVLAAQGRELVARARFASGGRWGSI
jgi:glycosyltransferase involved in cell wall biosynthesis